MPDHDDEELDEIVAREKPGFVRARKPAADDDTRVSPDEPDVCQTPDEDVIRRKADQLSGARRARAARPGPGSSEATSPPSDVPSGGSRGTGAPDAASVLRRNFGRRDEAEASDDVDEGRGRPSGGGRAEQPPDDDVDIVTVEPERAADAPEGPAQRKAVVISRSKKKIIGEQG